MQGGSRGQGFRRGEWEPPSNASVISLLSRGGERGVAVAHSLITSSNNKCLTCNRRKTEGGWVSGRKRNTILTEEQAWALSLGLITWQKHPLLQMNDVAAGKPWLFVAAAAWLDTWGLLKTNLQRHYRSWNIFFWSLWRIDSDSR